MEFQIFNRPEVYPLVYWGSYLKNELWCRPIWGKTLDQTYRLSVFCTPPYDGNPLGVVVTSQPLSSEEMAARACEINLSATAFVQIVEKGEMIPLRWFSAAGEIQLCGHGTIGASNILFKHFGYSNQMHFQTASGVLHVKFENDRIWLNMPVLSWEPYQWTAELEEILPQGELNQAVFAREAESLLVELPPEFPLKDYKPPFKKLEKISGIGALILTQRGEALYDFHSRYFTPWYGTPEDPVTGSAHRFLGAYWREVLKKEVFKAYQASSQGGVIDLAFTGSELWMSGAVKEIT